MPARFASTLASLALVVLVHYSTAASAMPTTITEFFNTTLAHYVLITSAAEVASIENGAAGPGWQKTGKNFNAHTEPADAPGLVPVCRFYGSISPGPNSHFFTADHDECSAVKNDPGWHYEGIAFHVALPADGECSANQSPVWRAYNNGFKPQQGINDGNHRFSVDRASIQKLVDSGWNDEGVVFCAQADNPSVPFNINVPTASLLLLPGASREVIVAIEPRNGFTGAVSLTASGLLPGVTHEFTPASVTLAAETVGVILRLDVAPSAAATTGTNIFTIGAAGSGGSAIAGIDHAIAAAGDPVALRLAAIAAVEKRCREFAAQGLRSLAFVQAIAAFMAGLPEYEETGVDADTISAWGRFKGGHVHIVANALESAPSATAAVRGSNIPLKVGAELPRATKARLLQPFGANAAEQVPVDEMRNYLRGKGWSVRNSDAHVGTLKFARGDGFFYINTHAGRYQATVGTIFSIQSATLVDSQYAQIFADDLALDRLTYVTANNFSPVRIFGVAIPGSNYDTRYGITHRFVDEYMDFASESVVMINACYSSTSNDFISAFLRKKAGVYLGWSNILDTNTVRKVGPYFVDRMVGANKYTADKESPPQRPFPYNVVIQDMDSKGLTTVVNTGARLQTFANPALTFPPIFAPSIRFVRVNEYDEELILDGEFGVDKPVVSVAGSPRTVKTWSATKLTTDLPRSGVGSSGDVLVEVRGVKSNARQLSEWSIPLTYTWTHAYGEAEFNFNGSGRLRFRADVAGYRLLPGEAPNYNTRGGTPTRDSALSITASGVHTEGGCTQSLTGIGNYLSPADPVSAQLGVISSAFKVEGETRLAALGMALGHPGGAATQLVLSGGQGCVTGSFPAPPILGRLGGDADIPADQRDSPTILRLPAAQFSLGQDYSMPAGLFLDFAGGGEIKLLWPTVPAKSPPRDTDDAGK